MGGGAAVARDFFAGFDGGEAELRGGAGGEVDYCYRVCGQMGKTLIVNKLLRLTFAALKSPTRNLPMLPHNNQIRKLLLLRQLHKVFNLILSPSFHKLSRRENVAEFLDELV